MIDTLKKLYEAVDEILWLDWDPIGIHNVAPRDEYRSYVPVIFSLRIQGASREVIAQKLFELETITIGVIGDMNNCQQVADKIVLLPLD